MKKIIKFIYLIIAASILLSCGNKEKPEPEKIHASENNSVADKSILVSFSRKQFVAMKIQMGSFEKKNLRTTVKANGTLELPPQNKANVTSYISGNITRILVTQGQAVQKGQVLGYIAHPDIISLQQEYLEDISQLSYISKEFERQKELQAENISAAKSLQKSEAELMALKGKLQALEAKLSLLNLVPSLIAKGNISSEAPISAPIGGYIAAIKVNIGSSVSSAADLFEITDNHHIHADLLVYEKDIYKIHDGQKVQFMLTNLPGELFTATIFSVGKSFEKDVKAVKVHADIDNPKGQLLPGTYVDARIQVDNASIDALPDEAIVREGELSFIYVLREEGKDTDSYIFQKVGVRTGTSDAGFTEVIPFQSLKPNARIVVKGTYYVSAQGKGGAEEE